MKKISLYTIDLFLYIEFVYRMRPVTLYISIFKDHSKIIVTSGA